MNKTMMILAVVALGSAQAVVAEQQPVKNKGKAVARPAAAPVRAHGAPAVGRSQAAFHASPQARVHAQSNVVRQTAPVARTQNVRSRANVVRATSPNVIRGNNRAQMNGARASSANVVPGNRAPINSARAQRQTAAAFNGPNGRAATARITAPAGTNYASFTDAQRSWQRQRHDRGWWSSRYNRIVLYGGGYYYWDNGWWYPAYGYDPAYSSYVYDGPIYGSDGVAPTDVVSETQQALAQQGYYNGPIDGIIGSGTRRAIRRYQVDHGLAVTSVIDQQTLYSLGLS